MRWVGESPCGRLAHDPAPLGHVAAPDPHPVRGVRTGAGGPGPLWGSEAPAISSELPFLRDTWLLRTHPQARGTWLLRPSRAVTDKYAGPALPQKEWVSLLQD